MQGGRYEIKNGKRVLVEKPTQDHPDGNMARDKDNQVIGREQSKPVKAKPVSKVKATSKGVK